MRDNEQPPVDPRLLAALAKADLDELETRLLGLARRKMWRRWKGIPPSGETPEDVVQKAFHQALSGVRKFPKGDVDLYVFLVMVVRSLISHLAEKEENRCVHISQADVGELLGRPMSDRSLELRPKRTSTPESSSGRKAAGSNGAGH